MFTPKALPYFFPLPLLLFLFVYSSLSKVRVIEIVGVFFQTNGLINPHRRLCSSMEAQKLFDKRHHQRNVAILIAN